jgi:hypothetical protein
VSYRLSNLDVRDLEERGEGRETLRPEQELPMVVAKVHVTRLYFNVLTPWRLYGAVLVPGVPWLWVDRVPHRRGPGGWDWLEAPDTQEEENDGPHPVPTAIVCSTCGLPWADHGESPTQKTCIDLLVAKTKPFAYLAPPSPEPSTFCVEKVEVR